MVVLVDVRGFILDPSYRIEQGRPVVHLAGVLEDGRAFVVRDRRQRVRFWIRQSDGERARQLGASTLEAAGETTLDGYPAACIEVRKPAATPPLRDRLSRHGIPTYEADVRFVTRFLLERGIHASVRIQGHGQAEGRVIGFQDPELRPDDWTPALRVLSIDIETDPKARRLLSIALSGCGADEVFLLCPDGYAPAGGALPFADEATLLAAFVRRLRALDPDILTGWNVVDFDLFVLQRLAGKLGVSLALGRDGGRLRLRPSRASFSTHRATIPGRVVLDGIQLLRGAFVKVSSYGLDAVARQVLGTGKVGLEAGDEQDPAQIHDRARAILDTFLHQRARFVAYNRRDAQLVLEILGHLHLIELAVERSKLTGLPLDRVAGSIAAFDFLYLEKLTRRGIVAPSVRDAAEIQGASDDAINLGGHVFEPRPGLYRNILVYDFKSLYPSVIRSFQIDPLGFLDDDGDPEAPRVPEAIVAPKWGALAAHAGYLDRDSRHPLAPAGSGQGDR